MNLRQDLDLVVHLVGDLRREIVSWPDEALRPRGSLDSDESSTEYCFVDVAMASFAEKQLFGEPICGGFEITVLEVLDLDRLVLAGDDSGGCFG